jgi:thermostable 8-oxoguanine DNA glycosylase
VKEKQLTELEETHAQKIKQLVQDFEKRLAQKDEENKMFGEYGICVFQKYTSSRYRWKISKTYVMELIHLPFCIPLNLFIHFSVLLQCLIAEKFIVLSE